MMGGICKNCKIGIYIECKEEYFEVVNPNGEFVQGYGSTLVTIQKYRNVIKCPRCGHKQGQKIIKLKD
jgi:hypothetical protein